MNGSFENYSSCPSNLNGGVITLATPWITSNSYSIPYLYNSCAAYPSKVGVPVNGSNFDSYQFARTGNGYASVNVYSSGILNLREFIVYPLAGQLESNKSYCLSFYVNLVNVSNYAIDAIGAYFSDTMITCATQSCLLNLPAQVSNPAGNILSDTLGWMQISGCFTAKGTEDFMLIGNFKTDAQTQTAINSNIYATTYFIDDVSLVEDTITSIEEIQNNEFAIYPNPSNGNFQINSLFVAKQIRIIDIFGSVVLKLLSPKPNENIDATVLLDGIYFVEFENDIGMIQKKKLVVMH